MEKLANAGHLAVFIGRCGPIRAPTQWGLDNRQTGLGPDRQDPGKMHSLEGLFGWAVLRKTV